MLAHRLIFSVLIAAGALLCPALARAVPADVVVVVDTSASMAKANADGQTRLSAAKRIASQVIDAATAGGHRVSLVRFAQIDQIVQGGDGKRTVFVEDENQCDHGANLLAPLTSDGAAEALRWLDGVDKPGNPELAALGDSPLWRATQVSFDYIRGKRQADPLHHCVNAHIVIVTDGADTCAGGGELQTGIATLASMANAQDVRAHVIAFDPATAAAIALARVGQGDDATARPYAVAEAPQLVDAIKKVEGRFAPEACLASGVKPAAIYAAASPSGSTGTDGSAAQTSGASHCAVGGQPGRPAQGSAVWLCALGAMLAARRAGRRTRSRTGIALPGVALLAVALSLTCTEDSARSDGSPGPVQLGEASLVDPAVARDEILARGRTVLAEIDAARRNLRPMLDPTTAFAAVGGDPVDGCAALARTIGYEPYPGAQRGPSACLGSRRCNSVDKAFFVKACLAANNVASEVHGCAMTDDVRAGLRAEAGKQLPAQDIAPVETRLRDALDKAFGSEPGLADTLRTRATSVDAKIKAEIATTIKADVDKLAPMLGLDAAATEATAISRLANAIEDHFVVVALGQTVDPTLAQAACDDTGNVVLEDKAIKLKVSAAVQYFAADVGWRTEVQLLETAFMPAVEDGAAIEVAITDAATAAIPAGLPPAASSGCLRLHVRAGKTSADSKPFYIGLGDGAACPEAPIVPEQGSDHLGRVTLYTETTTADGMSGTRRTLVDRYSYGKSIAGMQYSGPTYSNEMMRELAPMRVDIVLGGGVPSAATGAEALLANLSASAGDIEARISRQLGLPPPPASTVSPPPPLAAATLALFARQLSDLLPAKSWLTVERPWLLGVVQRRGFGAASEGLAVTPQTVFDVMDAPVLVESNPGEVPAQARLTAQLGVGAAMVEAERVATASYLSTGAVVNAGAMFRAASAKPWGTWGTAGYDQSLFPLAVNDARVALGNQTVIVTAGPQPFLGESYTAWWRADPEVGQLHGDVRYEGTIYGGAAGVKLIGEIDRCLFAAASNALGGTEDDKGATNCCIAAAVKDFIKDLAWDFFKGAVFAGAPLGNLEAISLPLYHSVKDIADLIEFFDGLADLNDLFESSEKEPPGCEAPGGTAPKK
jgi:hypothetical protein